jgi:hypothetical protein
MWSLELGPGPLFIHTEERAVEYLVEEIHNGGSADDIRILTVLVPEWEYAENEDELMAEARRRGEALRAADDRIERAAQALAELDNPGGGWGGYYDHIKEEWRAKARVALQAAEEAPDAG